MGVKFAARNMLCRIVGVGFCFERRQPNWHQKLPICIGDAHSAAEMVVIEMERKAARPAGWDQHRAGTVSMRAIGNQRVVGSESDVGSDRLCPCRPRTHSGPNSRKLH